MQEWHRVRASRLARNAAWLLLGQGLSVACQGVYFILLARLLGSTEYGIYAGAFAMVAILSVYAPLGSPFTMLRHVASRPGEFPLYWGNVLAFTITLGTLFSGVLVWLVPLLAHSYSRRLILCVAIGDCLGGQLIDGASRVFQAFEKMRITAALGLLMSLSRTIAAALMLWRLHHATAQQWVVVTLTVSLVSAVSALALVTRHYGFPRFSLELLRHRTSEGLLFALSSSTMSVYNGIDRAMLGHYGMNAANGIYTMAYRVVDISTIPLSSLHAAAFPRFFHKGLGGIESTSIYASQILKRTGPLAVLFTLIMLLGAPLIPHLAGESFAESTAAIRWLCLLPLFRSFQLSAGDALTGAGLLKLRLWIQSFAAIFNVGINLYLIPRFGWHGAAWSSLATDGLLGLLNWTALLFTRARTNELSPAPEFVER